MPQNVVSDLVPNVCFQIFQSEFEQIEKKNIQQPLNGYWLVQLKSGLNRLCNRRDQCILNYSTSTALHWPYTMGRQSCGRQEGLSVVFRDYNHIQNSIDCLLQQDSDSYHWIWGEMVFGEILQQIHYFSIHVYLQIHVNKIRPDLYIYQFHLCIGSLNLTMNTFPEYKKYFKFDFEYFSWVYEVFY